MKKTLSLRRYVVIALSVVLALFSLSGCASKQSIDAWSAPGTLKVMRNVYSYQTNEAAISLTVVKGETEGTQIVFQAKENVNDFDFVVTDLTCGDNVFPKSNVAVYVEKYINVLLKTTGQNNEAYPAGYTPDMLLPLETAKEYKENKCNAGDNQGIYVDFKIGNDVQPGVYTGEFELVVDNVTKAIPVSLDVRDVELGTPEGKQCFCLYQDNLYYGELDSSDEKYTAYYEFLLNEYKLCLMHVPNALQIDKFADSVIKYYDNPNFTSYAIPTFGYINVSVDAIYDYVYEIAKRCTPEKIYLDKAYVYPMMADEPYGKDKQVLAKLAKEAVDNLPAVIIDRLSREAFFDDKGGESGEFANRLRQALDDVPCVITSDAVELLADVIDTFCPPVQYYSTEYMRELYDAHALSNSGEKWFYTCMQPLYPYPSHHLDDYLIGSRIMRWMQKDYDLDGYLYWNVAKYNAGSDCYEDPVRFSTGGAQYNGDGYLVYPGVKYGSENPFPSLRLVTWRDGQEDYDLLCLLNKLFDENVAQYTDDLKFDDITSSVYDALYSGTIYDESDENFYDCRNRIINMVEGLQSSAKAIVYQNRSGVTDEIVVYASADSEVFANGRKVEGEISKSGKKFVVDESGVVSIKVKSGSDETDCVFTNGKRTKPNVSQNSFTVSDGSTVSVADGRADFTITSKGDTAYELSSFKPSIFISPDAVGGNLNKLENVSFGLTNCDSVVHTVEIQVVLKDGTAVTVDKIALKSGENDVKINGLHRYYSYTGKKIERLRLSFVNAENGVKTSDKHFTISDFSYSLSER